MILILANQSTVDKIRNEWSRVQYVSPGSKVTIELHQGAAFDTLPTGKLNVKGKSADRTGYDTYSMIRSARSLQRVANELEEKGHEPESSDEWPFEGKFLACPILLSLATGIALKAWQCSERQAPPDRTHDLLKLFKSLKQDTQEMLEARMRKVSPWAMNAEQLGMHEAPRDVQDMFFARTHPLRDVLSDHSDANLRWRFLYERHMETFETGEVDNALTVIIDAYNERRWF